jgi:uncharacterized protein (DUF302 family)
MFGKRQPHPRCRLPLSRENKTMSYYFSKTLSGNGFNDMISRVTEALQAEGFGILTEIDVRATMKKKLDEDFRDYRILGACNPALAHRALQAEGKIGTMLPCNVIVQATDEGVEVAAVDPVASMQAVDNPDLARIAETVRDKLKHVIDVL